MLKNNQRPEVLGALATVADVGVGVPRETGIGAAILAGRIGSRLGLNSSERVAAFYASLLRYTGCSVAAMLIDVYQAGLAALREL